jgi:uncharacterized protein YbjT (DUF2867 family)
MSVVRRALGRMRIVTTTPTGHVGSHAVRALLRAGVRPTVLVRDPDRLDPELRERVDAVRVDLTERAAVIDATGDADALFFVAPDTGGEDPVASNVELGAIVAEAVRANHIAHVVFQSSAGAEARGGFGEIDGLGAIEQALDDAVADTGTAVTHLRCGYFFTNLELSSEQIAAGTLTATMPTDLRIPWVDPRDIAEVAVGRLLAPVAPGTHITGVHGPADLSLDDAAAVLTAALGREVHAERISDDAFREAMRGFGVGDTRIESTLRMSVGTRDPGFVPEVPRSVATTTPSTLDGWVRSTLVPALAG